MLNIVILTGHVVELPVLRKTSKRKKYATIVLEIPRYRGSDLEEFSHDRVAITLVEGHAQTAVNVCSLGDTLAIRARVQTYSVEMDGITYYNYEFIAETISFFNDKSR